MCVSGVIIASREAAEALLRHEPMTLKSCAPGLPNNRPDRLKSDTPRLPFLEHHRCCSLLFQAARSARGQAGEMPTSFKSYSQPPTTPLPPPPPSFTSPSWYFMPDIDPYFKTTTETHVPFLSWHKRFVEMGSPPPQALTTSKPPTSPCLHPPNLPTLHLNWQTVLLFCNAKQSFALCFSGIWAHDQNTWHRHPGMSFPISVHPHPQKKRYTCDWSGGSVQFNN